MVLDSSALIAVLFNEPDRESFLTQIERASVRFVSAVTAVETFLVYSKRKPGAQISQVKTFLSFAKAEIVPVDEIHVAIACEAFLRYGKGRHPAKLNFGDCFSYALAKSLDMPLLFKGDDFSKTDVKVA